MKDFESYTQEERDEYNLKQNRISELKNYLNNTWRWKMERYNAEKAEIGLGIRVADNYTISFENLIISRKEAVDEINQLEDEIVVLNEKNK